MKRLLIELTDEEYKSVFENTTSYHEAYTIQDKLQSGVNIDEKEIKMYLVSSFEFTTIGYEPLLVFFDLEKASEYVDKMKSNYKDRSYKIDEINTGDYMIELPVVHRYRIRFNENIITVDEEDVPEDFDKNWISISGTKDTIIIRLYDNDRPSAIEKAKSILKGINEKYLSVELIQN